MKKNITINLCGRLYQIDEDAYELLSHYTETLRNYFLKQEGGKEIADDIEERIAELFDDLKAKGTEAITIEHVEEVIHQIGQVEEIAGEDTSADTSKGTDAQASASEKTQQTGTTKKFYRDSQNKMLAGVCAGCAQYFGGSANGWRWGYALACIAWWLLTGITPLSVGGFFALIPFAFLLAPIAFAPFVPYLLTAIIAPETQTPEDVLKMKGKEVNPQNLATEVQEGVIRKKTDNGSTFWKIFVGIISVGLSTLLTIGFIVALTFFVIFLVASETMADSWWNIYEPEDLQAITFPVILSGIMLLCSIGILLFCSIHAAISSFGKTPSMKVRQRVMWFLLWVASVIGFIGCTTWAVNRLAKTQTARWDKRAGKRTDGIEVTITDELGHPFNETDYYFFKENDWEMVTAEHTDRYTYSGEYFTGDEDVRYLDDCNDYEPLIYTARKHEDDVEPGYYRLSAAVKANDVNKFIYLYGITIDEETNDTVTIADKVKEIPNCGLEKGNIWELLSLEEGNAFISEYPNTLNDPVLKELVDRLPERDKRKVLGAHDGLGYGWSYIYIDSIKVDKPHNTIFYGVTTDKEITGHNPTTGWFSATDFKLEKIANL